MRRTALGLIVLMGLIAGIVVWRTRQPPPGRLTRLRDTLASWMDD